MKINLINFLGQRLQKIILHRSGGPAVLHQVRPEWVEGGAVPRPPAWGVPAASATPTPTPSGPTHQSGKERTLLEVRVHKVHKLYTWSTTMSVPSSELGLPHHLSHQRVCPTRTKGGVHTRLRVRGWRVPIRTTGEKA
jgi:hypothetical protein